MFERVEGWNKLQIACTFDIRGKKMALKTRHFSENSGVDKKWNDIWEAWMRANLTSVKECSYHAYFLKIVEMKRENPVLIFDTKMLLARSKSSFSLAF